MKYYDYYNELILKTQGTLFKVDLDFKPQEFLNLFRLEPTPPNQTFPPTKPQGFDAERQSLAQAARFR